MKTHELDGKFAVTKFHNVGKYEKADLDRSSFYAICEKLGVDGSLFSAPSNFAKWDTAKQVDEICYLFFLDPSQVIAKLIAAYALKIPPVTCGTVWKISETPQNCPTLKKWPGAT